MIERFAPYVYLYSGDVVRPSDVDSCLNAATLCSPNGTKLTSTGSLTANHYSALLNQSYVSGSTAQHSGAWNNLAASRSGYSLYYHDQENLSVTSSVYEPPAGSVLRGWATPNNQCTAPCYAHVRVMSDAYEIVYCFFYPFNGPTGVGGYLPDADVHVGDWEHITVRVDKDQTTLQGVYFARHDMGDGQYLSKDDCSFYGSTSHVLAYSAGNSHGTYSSSGRHDNPSDAATFFGTYDYTDTAGPTWETWNYVVDVGDISSPTTGYEWIRFSGKWGNTDGVWIGAAGPASPPFQAWWSFGDLRLVGNEQISVINNSDAPNPATGGIPGAAYDPVRSRIYAIYPGWGASETLYHLSFDGTDWRSNSDIDITSSNDHPRTSESAGVAYNQHDANLYIAYPGAGQPDIWLTTYDGDNWNGNQKIEIGSDYPGTAASPSLAYFPEKSRLYMVYRGNSNNEIYQASLDSSGDWHGNSKITLSDDSNPQTNVSPALAYYPEQRKLYLVFTDTTSHDLYMVTYDGNNWTGNQQIKVVDNADDPEPQCPGSPALAYFNGKLHMVYSGMSECLYYSVFDGSQWTGNYELQIYGTALKTDTTPGMAVIDNKLYLIYPGWGIEGQMYWAYLLY